MQGALSDDLLKPYWLKKRKPSDHPTFGHCYLSAEALFYLWGKQRGYKAQVLSGPGWTHWYLMDDKGRKADPSAEQWKERIPYERGEGNGFFTITGKPSKRCRVMLARIRRMECGRKSTRTGGRGRTGQS